MVVDVVGGMVALKVGKQHPEGRRRRSREDQDPANANPSGVLEEFPRQWCDLRADLM